MHWLHLWTFESIFIVGCFLAEHNMGCLKWEVVKAELEESNEKLKYVQVSAHRILNMKTVIMSNGLAASTIIKQYDIKESGIIPQRFVPIRNATSYITFLFYCQTVNLSEHHQN